MILDPKTALANLPADMQQSIAANLCMTLAMLLHGTTGGTVIVATLVPGRVDDHGKPIGICVPIGDMGAAKAMLADMQPMVDAMAQQAQAVREQQAQAQQATEKGN